MKLNRKDEYSLKIIKKEKVDGKHHLIYEIFEKNTNISTKKELFINENYNRVIIPIPNFFDVLMEIYPTGGVGDENIELEKKYPIEDRSFVINL